MLREPEDVRTKTGDPFKVYTPFWRALTALGAPSVPSAGPKDDPGLSKKIASDRLADWKLLPKSRIGRAECVRRGHPASRGLTPASTPF